MAEHAQEIALAKKGGKDVSSDASIHEWLGPFEDSGGKYWIGTSAHDVIVLTRILDLPTAGNVSMINETVNQSGIWGGKGNRDWFGPYTLKEGEYWVLGDNRDNSADSRFFGPVQLNDIKGKLFYRFPHVGKIVPNLIGDRQGELF